MSTIPPEAPPSQDQHEPGASGPRVTRDEMKDLGRIRRSRTDRKVAGVAAGIARHLDVDPLLVRVGFVLLVIFGGAGILAYGACWLLVPEEDTDDAVVRVDDRTRTVILAIVAVASAVALIGDSVGEWGFPWPLAVGAVVLAVVMASRGRTRQHPFSVPVPPPGTPGMDGGPPQAGDPTYVGYRPPVPPKPADPRKRGPILFPLTLALAALLVGVVGTIDLAGAELPAAAYPATVLATCGLMLVVGAFYGRAGGLILVGLVAAVATALTTVADDVSAGQLTIEPRTAAELGDSYELGFGEIVVDLRELQDVEKLDGQTLDLDVFAGHIEVILPDPGLDVVVHTEIGGEGRAVVFNKEREGGGVLDGRFDGGQGDTPQLTINAELDLGEIEVYTEEVTR